jgi:hypothetical protein
MTWLETKFKAKAKQSTEPWWRLDRGAKVVAGGVFRAGGKQGRGSISEAKAEVVSAGFGRVRKKTKNGDDFGINEGGYFFLFFREVPGFGGFFVPRLFLLSAEVPLSTTAAFRPVVVGFAPFFVRREPFVGGAPDGKFFCNERIC